MKTGISSGKMKQSDADLYVIFLALRHVYACACSLYVTCLIQCSQLINYTLALFSWNARTEDSQSPKSGKFIAQCPTTWIRISGIVKKFATFKKAC